LVLDSENVLHPLVTIHKFPVIRSSNCVSRKPTLNFMLRVLFALHHNLHNNVIIYRTKAVLLCYDTPHVINE